MNTLSERMEAIALETDRRFGDHGPLSFFRAPGRVDVMGSHTDYNQGFILAATVDRDIVVGARPRRGGVVNLYSLDMELEVRLGKDRVRFDREHGWANYPKGVLKEFLALGLDFDGLDLVYAGNVPIGGNLSSSAALEASTLEAALGITEEELPDWEKVHLCHRAENLFVGVPCGVMDQFTVVMGRQGAALMLDCQSLQFETIPFSMKGAGLAVIDSGQGRELAAGKYAERVEECKRAVKGLAKLRPDIKSLRDARMEELIEAKDRMDETAFRRARHVLTENDRVTRAAEAMKNSDPAGLGAIMEEGYRSCRTDYKNSTPELDILHDLIAGEPGVMGVRICGAGFGGCLLALIEVEKGEENLRRQLLKFESRTGLKGDLWVVNPSSGAGPVN